MDGDRTSSNNRLIEDNIMEYVAVKINSEIFTLVSRKGAWLTLEDGRKIRNGEEVEFLTQEDLDIEEEFGDKTEFTMDDFEVEQELADDGDEDESPIETMSSHIGKYTYTTHSKIEGVTESGRSVTDNEDDIANMFRGVWLHDLYDRVAAYIDVPEDELRAKYAHLNNGQQSMCLRNRVRGYLNKKNKEG